MPSLDYLCFIIAHLSYVWSSLVAQMVKNPPQCGRSGFNPWVGKIAWKRKWQPTPVFFPGESQGQRNLAGYSPLGHKELDMTEWLRTAQQRLHQYMNRQLPDIQAGFRKGRGTRYQIANICWIMEKGREFQKKYLFLLFWLCQSLWLCGSQWTVENSEKDGNARLPDLPLEKSVCRSGSHS